MNNQDSHTTTINNLFNYIKYAANSELDNNDIEFMSSQFVDSMVLGYISHPDSKDRAKSQIERMRKLIDILLMTIDKGFEKSLNRVDEVYRKIERFERFSENYPPYVIINHSQKCLLFFKKLNKEEYGYSETGELLGISRQTVSNYVKDGKFGSDKTIGKKKITKEGLYLFFVNQEMSKRK